MTTPITTPRRIKIRNLPPALPDTLPVMDSPSQEEKVVVIACRSVTYANYDEYLASEVWQKKRKEIIDRDGEKCRLCNSDKILHVHHRNYPKIYGEEPDEDLITLCRKCHYIFHKNCSTHQLAKKTIKSKKKYSPGKPNIPPSLQKLAINYLYTDGLVPSRNILTNREIVRIICFATGTTFPETKRKRKEFIEKYVKNHETNISINNAKLFSPMGI